MRRGRRAVRSQGIPKHGETLSMGQVVPMGLLEDDAHSLGALGTSCAALTLEGRGGQQLCLAQGPSGLPGSHGLDLAQPVCWGCQGSRHSPSDAAGCLGRAKMPHQACPGGLSFIPVGLLAALKDVYTLEN